MPAVCRIGDPISCGDNMANGSPNVFANAIPVTRINTDDTSGHCYSPTPIASGSPNVYINGIAVARLTDPIVTHCCPGKGCHGGNISGASPNVYSNG